MNSIKMPKGFKILCSKHGDTMKYRQGAYYCLDKFDGSYCAQVFVQQTKDRNCLT